MIQTQHLPPSPPDRAAWPWTEAPDQLPQAMPDGRPWPRISVVVPSYNQGQYLEETLRSLLLQGYPNLEVSVRDGGSTDASVAIIERYAPWLTSWVSQKDGGQAQAINAGWALATGDLIGWLNSDDYLLPGALERLALAHRAHPDFILLGDVEIFSEDGLIHQHWEQRAVTVTNMVCIWLGEMRWSQPGTFVPMALHQQVGPLDETLRYVFDRDWMIKLLSRAQTHYLHSSVARFRMHAGSKTVGEGAKWLPEHLKVTRRYLHLAPGSMPRAVTAEQLLWYGALPNLSVARGSIDRAEAFRYMMLALAADPRTLVNARFWLLAAMLLTPSALMRAVRPFIQM